MLVEEVGDCPVSGRVVPPSADGETVLVHGEMTGHRHAFHDCIVLFRDDGLARDIPAGLYVGHVKVGVEGAVLVHDEHAPITLDPGTYRVRRQRRLDIVEVGLIED